VNKLNAKRLPLRIAQHLGLGAPPSDWSNDGTGLFRSFNCWREQVGLDFVIESYPRGTYECSLTDEHRRERDGYDYPDEQSVSGRGKTVSEAICRAWLKVVIERARQKTGS